MADEPRVKIVNGQKFIRWSDSPVWVRMGEHSEMWDEKTQRWVPQSELDERVNDASR